jgi:hypothetical protein
LREAGNGLDAIQSQKGFTGNETPALACFTKQKCFKVRASIRGDIFQVGQVAQLPDTGINFMSGA